MIQAHPALREYGKVEVFQMPGHNRVYTSATEYGEEPPSSFSSSMSGTPTWKSGGAPNMGAAIHKALGTINHNQING